jgi:hypothetical protein
MSNTPEEKKKGRANYSSAISRANRKRKRLEAEHRDTIYVDLTVQQRIDRAKDRRGESKREIARLGKLLVKKATVKK